MNKILTPLLTVIIFSHLFGQDNEQAYWYQKPMRILQTVLRQPDAAHYNVDSLIQYMQMTHTNTLVINGGGIIDYFQNNLPMANINPYIGNRDLLAEIVDGCHAAGFKVITRVDFRGVEKKRYAQHPDWFAKNEKGEPIILNYTTPGLYAPCYNSYYRNEHAVQFISQLMEKYQIDGIWHNSVNFHHTCYCDRCKSDFKKTNGVNIPVNTSSKNDWKRYDQWKAGVAERQLALMRNTVKKYGADKAYAAEVFDLYKIEQQKHTGISLYSAAEYFDFFVIVAFIADNTAQVEYKDIYYPAAITKFLKSLKPDKAPVILFGGNGTEHRYIYDPPLDSRLWLWEGIASGGGFWNCYFNGYFPGNAPDARNAYLNSDAYEFLETNEVFIRNLQPVTDIGILYSKPSGELVGDNDFANSMKGVLRFLEENHLQYGFIADQLLTPDQLRRVKILVLPNVTVLNDSQLQMIEKWVQEGGKLIASFETSLFNEHGEERADFGLKEVFGVSYLQEKVNTNMDCYQKIIFRNALVADMEQTTLLHNSGNTLLTKTLPGAQTITGYLPKINNQPPENAFPASWESEHPVMVLNEFGLGTSIYFSNEIDKLNYTIGHPDYDQLLRNSISYLIGSANVLQTNAPPSVHVYLNQSTDNPKEFMLSLVNASGGPMRPFRQLIPARDITITLPFEIKSAEKIYPQGTNQLSIDKNQVMIDLLDQFSCVKIVGH